jgi:hypothetical protein
MDMLSEKIQKPIYIKNLDIGSVEKNRQEFTPSVLSTSMLQVLQEDHESNNITFGDMLDAKGPQQAYIPNTLLSQSQEIEDINFQGPKIEIPQIQNMVLTRKNTDVIEIQLYPESLGKVDVKVSMQQSTGNMEAVFAPETVEGYQAVLKEQHKLTDSLLTLLHKETKKEGSSAAIIEIRITEPKSLDSAFSSTDKNFFGASTSSFNSQDGHKGQSFSEKAYSFASKIYSESQIIEQDKILDNNRRLDLAI